MLNAHQIEDALYRKYNGKYVCVRQCKTGPTVYSNGLGIIDFWVMSKSWAHQTTIGHEIKVSRSDFLNDHKWQNYLPYCNELYFVVSSLDVARPEEMPADAGLMVCSQTGNVIYTKKKAPYRDIQIDESIFRYILMNRSTVSKSELMTDKRKFWEDWLENKKLSQALGWRVSKAINEKIKTEIETVQGENRRFTADNENLLEVKAYLESIGLDYHRLNNWSCKRTVAEKLEEIKTGYSKEFQNHANECIKLLTLLSKEFEG